MEPLDEKKKKHKKKKSHKSSGGYGGGYFLGRPFFYGNDGLGGDRDEDNSVGTDFGNSVGDYGGMGEAKNTRMKIKNAISLLESLTGKKVLFQEDMEEGEEEIEVIKARLKKIPTNPFPESIYNGDRDLDKYLISKKGFIYYAAYDDDTVYMYNAKTGKLVSDNWMAENDLAGIMQKKNIDKFVVWMSDNAKENYKLQHEQEKGIYDDDDDDE